MLLRRLIERPNRSCPWLLGLSLLVGSVGKHREGNDLLRLVTSAQSAIRAGRSDEARLAYLEAAKHAPEIEDWLILRAAELTRTSAVRTALYGSLSNPVARSRAGAVEAAARERAGDLRGASVRYDSLGRPADALRLRLRLARTASELTTIRRELAGLLEQRPVNVGAQHAADLLTSRFAPLTPAEALGVARIAVEKRQFGRAAEHYPSGLNDPRANPADRLAYARSLLGVRRVQEALQTLSEVTGPTELRTQAALDRARAHLRLGDRAAAAAELDRVEAFAVPDSSLVQALILAGDLAWDDGRLDRARRKFLDVSRRVPTSELAPRASWLAALVAWDQGHVSVAAEEWDELRSRVPRSEATAAAGYWAGRAWHQLGFGSKARVIWEEVRSLDTLSYYGLVSAEQLGVAPWAPVDAPDQFALPQELEAALRRMARLQEIGFVAELAWERDWLVAESAGSPDRALLTAHAFRVARQPALGARLARRALMAGAAADGRTYRLLYPLPRAEQVEAAATGAGVSPLLVAALIRQESLWDERATSKAGARGLMQVMPATGAQVARRLRLSGWDAERLYDPYVNLRIGTAYLADMLARCERDLVCALAGYNAGPSRIQRWRTRPGAEDRDFLIERMQFTETREYVKTVYKNLALYRSLYVGSR